MSQTKYRAAFIMLAALIPFSITLADWDVGDPASYYQLPDYTGWDVYSGWGNGTTTSEGYAAADDWTAATTSAVTDIYFWGAWNRDVIGETGNILIQIFSNNAGEPDFPKPDELLWSSVIQGNQYTRKLYYDSQTNDQGWYDPRDTDTWQADDHEQMFQYSIANIADPFEQQAGETYWLMISMNFEGWEWGWRTTPGTGSSNAVFWDSKDMYDPQGGDLNWTQLLTPEGAAMDMSFVIAPEPATLLLLSLGGIALRRKK